MASNYSLSAASRTVENDRERFGPSLSRAADSTRHQAGRGQRGFDSRPRLIAHVMSNLWRSQRIRARLSERKLDNAVALQEI